MQHRRSGHTSFRQLQVRSDAACQCLARTPFMFCGVLHFLTTAMNVSFCVATVVSEMLRGQVLFRFQMPSRWHWSAGAKKNPQRCRMSVPSLDLVHVVCQFTFTHHLLHTATDHLSHIIFHTQLCHTLSFTHTHTHHFHTGNLSHTTLSHTHTIFLCHTPSFTHNFVTHTHAIFLCHTPTFTCNFVIHNLHHLLRLSFLPRPCYNISCSLLEEVDLWGYPVL